MCLLTDSLTIMTKKKPHTNPLKFQILKYLGININEEEEKFGIFRIAQKTKRYRYKYKEITFLVVVVGLSNLIMGKLN